MPLYEWRCKKCRAITTTVDRVQPTCQLCEISMGRRYSFYSPTAFQPHFNHAVGQFVSSKAEFNDKLKRLSDQQSIRTGIPHNYVPVEQGDQAAFGANDEGMESYYQNRHNKPITDDIEYNGSL